MAINTGRQLEWYYLWIENKKWKFFSHFEGSGEWRCSSQRSPVKAAGYDAQERQFSISFSSSFSSLFNNNCIRFQLDCHYFSLLFLFLFSFFLLALNNGSPSKQCIILFNIFRSLPSFLFFRFDRGKKRNDLFSMSPIHVIILSFWHYFLRRFLFWDVNSLCELCDFISFPFRFFFDFLMEFRK